jgi:hypothetical protein
MTKHNKQLGGNSHQRTIASTAEHEAAGNSVQPHIARQEKHMQKETGKPRVWASVFGIPVISALALALITAGGVGVLSMNPPEVKLAYWCFSIGYFVLLSRIIYWAALDCADSKLQKVLFVIVAIAVVGVVGIASLRLASSRSPVSLTLKFESFTTAVGNLPERAKVSTWDGGPWNENGYADVRLRIDNVGAKIRDLDLSLKLVGESDSGSSFYVIPAIGQTTELHGVEFIPPQPQEMTINLRGIDNKLYTAPFPMNFGKGWSTLPPRSIRVIVPQLLDGQHLTLIIGTSHASASNQSKAPKYIEVSGTGDALINGNTRQGIVATELVLVKPNIEGVTIR